jgi:PAS domain S-box-containing protein
MTDPDPESTCGRLLWDLQNLTGDEPDRLEAAFRRVLSGEDVSLHLEDAYAGPTREPTVLDLSLTSIRDEADGITEVLMTATDITTAWHAAVASAKAEERFRSLLTHTRDYVCCFEHDPPIPIELPPEEQTERFKEGVLVECNEQFAEHHGYADVEAVLGKSQREIAPSSRIGIDRLFESFVSSGYRLEDVEVEIRKPDGSRRYIANNGHGVIEDGGLIRRWGAFRDITSRVIAEKDLRSALGQIPALKAQLEQENLELREEVERAHGFTEIIGEDPKVERCLEIVSRLAPTDAAALILGETGTGKELIARALHSRSPRHEQSLIKVNCAALPSELIESELFGHEKGAFTGAHSKRIGRFELADGGSLFLDEVGDLPFELQGKLLRVLQEGEFERLGGTTTLSVDVRIIAATNKDLREEVDRGAFRADLFYRINTFTIVLPPLRERRGDILLLVKHFIDKHSERFERRIESISQRTLRYLREHEWPGNIRELEGFVERALIATSGAVLDYTDEPETVLFSPTRHEESAPPPTAPPTKERKTALREAERSHIETVLKQCDWVVEGRNGAAARLGIAPSTLRSKMKRLKIERPAASQLARD